MNDIDALKKERDDIVARMDMTRTRYRAEMLINRRLVAAGYRGGHDLRFAHDVFSDHFPRSVTFKILTRYPVASGAAAVALLVLGPRHAMRSLFTAALAFAPGLLANTGGGAMLAKVMPMAMQWMASRPERGAGEA